MSLRCDREIAAVSWNVKGRPPRKAPAYVHYAAHIADLSQNA